MILHDNSKIKDNGFLCELDMESATQEETLAWLSKIIENELQKPDDEQDQDLIVECLAYIDDLLAEEVVCSEQDLQTGLEQILQSASKPAPEAPITLPIRIPRRKKLLKVLALVAACLLLVFSGISILAASQGYGCAWALIKENIDKITQLNSGGSISEGNITFFKNGEPIVYDSIEDFLNTENYNFMIFDYLPKGIQMRQLAQEQIDDTRIKIFFLFDSSNISVAIHNYRNATEDDLKKHPLYKTEYIDFYIEKKEAEQYLAIGYFNGYEYQIVYDNYEELLKILDSMKGITS